jgi:hypothetical protein
MTGLRDCTTAIMSRIFIMEAWSQETPKSNEINWDGVFAEHGRKKTIETRIRTNGHVSRLSDHLASGSRDLPEPGYSQKRVLSDAVNKPIRERHLSCGFGDSTFQKMTVRISRVRAIDFVD